MGHDLLLLFKKGFKTGIWVTTGLVFLYFGVCESLECVFGEKNNKAWKQMEKGRKTHHKFINVDCYR